MVNDLKFTTAGDYMNEEIVEVDLQAILLQAPQELNLKVETLRARVEQLENKDAI